VPAIIVLGFWFVLQLIDGVAALGIPAAEQPGVAFFAHIGGFVAGALAARFLGRVIRPGRPPAPAPVG
jgi:membrane associated rhomboid family serine protease